MYIHKILHTQVEEIYTYNGNNVNTCLAKIIMSVVPIFISLADPGGAHPARALLTAADL